MKVLLVGSLPPPYLPRSRALLAEAVELLEQGHELEVVALDPVATAHRYLGMSGVPASLQLLRAARGFDSVVVQLQPGLPVRAGAGQLERAVSLRIFASAMRRTQRSSVRVDALDDVPGGVGGRAALRVWRSAAEIRTPDAEVKDKFLRALGAGADGLQVTVSRGVVEESDLEPADVALDGSLADALELVRSRAARERRALGAAEVARPAGWDRLPTPGLAMTESDLALLAPPEGPRKPADLARKALAAADRRPGWWRVARVVRLSRRTATSLLRRQKSD